MKLAIQADSHIGKVAEVNEDSFAVQPTSDGGTLLMVCDGMGGMGGGDEASRLAVEHLIGLLESGGTHPVLRAALLATDQEIRRTLVGGEGVRRPGCTAVLAMVRDAQAWIAWAGDSRAYHLRDGQVLQRTRDHKLLQDLIDGGQLSEAEAKRSRVAHVITQCLGGRTLEQPPVQPSTADDPWSLMQGDALLLCSDGLYDLVEDEEIAQLVHAHDTAVKDLVQLALDRGGHDNISIVLARVAEAPEAVMPEIDDATTDAVQRPALQPAVPSPANHGDPLLELVEQTTTDAAGAMPRAADLSPSPPPAPLPKHARTSTLLWVAVVIAVLGVLAGALLPMLLIGGDAPTQEASP